MTNIYKTIKVQKHKEISSGITKRFFNKKESL